MNKPLFPSEWVPHAATWFSWPTNVDTWTDVLDRVRRKLGEAMVAIAEGEIVLVNVTGAEEARQVREYTRNHPNIVTLDLPSNDSWCRDHGPTFLLKGKNLGAVSWHYNAWGNKYPPFDLDDALAGKMSERLGVKARQSRLTLEGGALESNGNTILLTTASCVLNPNRNPGLTKKDAEQELIQQLGLPHVGWLSGDLEGDDTDGHIDNLARFVAADHVLLPVSLNTPENRSELQRVGKAAGIELKVGFLPDAQPIFYEGGALPCSHMNFYIANACIVLPAYGGPSDDVAASVLSDCFPDRKVVKLDCTDVIRGLGAIHCLTQQVPWFEGFDAPEDDFKA